MLPELFQIAGGVHRLATGFLLLYAKLALIHANVTVVENNFTLIEPNFTLVERNLTLIEQFALVNLTIFNDPISIAMETPASVMQIYSQYSDYPLPKFRDSFNATVLRVFEEECGSHRLCFSVGNLTGNNLCGDCSCDESCWKYGNCCPDLAIKIGLNVAPTYSCEVLENPINWLTKGIFMKKTCPMLAEDVNSSRCGHYPTLQSLFAPLTSENGKTFASIFCSSCHGVKVGKPWTLFIKCILHGIIYNIGKISDFESLSKRGCELYYRSPDHTLMTTCDLYKRDTCVRNGTWLTEACRIFSGIVMEYKNIFCYLCREPINIVHPINVNTAIDFRFRYARRFDQTGTGCQYFDASKMEALNCRLVSPPLIGQQFDNFAFYSSNEFCRELYCSPGKNLSNGECQPLMVVTEVIYRLDMTLKSNSNDLYQMNLTSLVLAMADFYSRVKEKLVNVQVGSNFIIKMMHITDATAVNDDVEFRIDEIVTVLTLKSTVERDVIEFENNMTALYDNTWDILIGSDTVQFTSIDDGEGRRLVTDRGRATPDEPEFSPLSAYPFTISLDGGGWRDPSYNVTRLLHCPQVRLNNTEYDKDNDTREVVIKASCVKLQYWEYTEQFGDTIQVCVEDFIKKTCIEITNTDEITWDAQSIMSATLIAISMICLLLTLVNFGIFPKTRTLPGKNTMGLCVTLFLTQGLLQFGGILTQYPTLCKVLGVLTHYFFICTFSWMTICSFHMYRVFCTMTTKDTDAEENRLYWYYVLLSNGISATVVVTTIIVNSQTSQDYYIGYGQGLCYLTGELNVGLAAMMPVVISILLNCLFFGRAAYAIYRTRQLARNVSNEKQHVYVYIKLSTLTGLTWITSIIAVTSQNVILEYISIILNASQGIFIFVAYVCTKRVWTMYMKKWHRARRQPEDSYALSSTDTSTTKTQVSI